MEFGFRDGKAEFNSSYTSHQASGIGIKKKEIMFLKPIVCLKIHYSYTKEVKGKQTEEKWKKLKYPLILGNVHGWHQVLKWTALIDYNHSVNQKRLHKS